MSISSTATKVTYSGNNSTVTPYPISFKYLEDAHVNVYIDGVLQVEGAGQNYVLAGDGTAGTGTFTTTVAQAGTKSVVVVLDVALDQPVSLQETGSLPAKTLEQAYDRLNMQIRRVWRKAQDVLTFSSDEGGTGSTGTADNLIGFDGSGDIAEIPNTTFLLAADDITASDVVDFDAAVGNTTTVAANTADRHVAVTKSGTPDYVSVTGQDIVVAQVDLAADVTGNLPIANLNAGTNATSSTFWRGDGTWFAPSGSGDMVASIYDPTTIAGSAFLMDNMTEGTTTKILTDSERTLIGSALQSIAANSITSTELDAATTTSLGLADTALQSIAADSVTYDMVQDVTATDKILGRSTAGAGTVEEITCTLAGRNLIDDADASAQRTTLGVAIGTDVQAYSSTLDDIVTPPSVTGTLTATNSTNNISLTGVGDLANLEVGDVIEITGSASNNQLYSVDEVTDSNNILVNQDHNGQTTTQALTDETTASVTISVYCRRKYVTLGMGQGWVAKAYGTALQTNSRGRAIMYNVTNGGSTNCQVEVDGVIVIGLEQAGIDTSATGSCIIPDGSTFQRNQNSSVGSQIILS
jgi:hypothetical protein